MAKKKTIGGGKSLKMSKNGTIHVKNREELALALQEAQELQEQIEPLMRRVTELKKGAVYYAAEKRIDVVQLDGSYWRLISRTSRGWDASMLRKIVGKKKVKIKGKMKPLWNLLTKRVPDPDAINDAINEGFVDEGEIEEAFIERPQQPFMQRYEGVAD